eukprot:6561445-Prorocentrum_lima.AAC.1
MVQDLAEHFKEQDQAEVVRIAAKHKSFHRRPDETVDEALARFDMLHSSAIIAEAAEASCIK